MPWTEIISCRSNIGSRSVNMSMALSIVILYIPYKTCKPDCLFLLFLVYFSKWNAIQIKHRCFHRRHQLTRWTGVHYIPRNMHTVFALLCFVVVIHWLIFLYPSGLLHWHCGNLTIAPVPAKQPYGKCGEDPILQVHFGVNSAPVETPFPVGKSENIWRTNFYL